MSTPNPSREIVPAHCGVSNLLQVWKTLRQGIPNRLDENVLDGYPESTRGLIIQAHEFLGLIDSHARPTGILRELVTAPRHEKPRILRRILFASYSEILDPQAGGITLATVTPERLQERFCACYGIQGNTVRKSIGLLIALASLAEVPISPLLLHRRQRRTWALGRRRGPALPRDGQTCRSRGRGAVRS